MWLGALYFTTAGDANGTEAPRVLMCAWQDGRDRPLTVEGPLYAAPHIARTLRECLTATGFGSPRCDACGTPLDLPLD